MTRKTIVKVFEYIPESDSFAVIVNESALCQVAASWFSEKHEIYRQITEERLDGNHVELTSEEYCYAMIYEMHFREDPTDLCYTFYQVTL